MLRITVGCLWMVLLFMSPGGLFAGALDGERYRVLISSDIGGSDEDDDQSLVHYLHYADLFDTEGLVSSPPHKGRVMDFLEVIELYEKDFPIFQKQSKSYPAPGFLRGLCKQGATEVAPEKGYSQSTEGSRWIIECAKKEDPRPLYVLVWGSITDVAQALHDEPGIKEKIRVYFIASWNQRQDPHSFTYIDEHHSDLWMIYCNTTFRGWYVGGEQSGDLGNKSFIDQHIKGWGALGEYFDSLKYNQIKMGDTPSVAYLLTGDPGNPESDHWGGRFVRKEGRKNWWVDDTRPEVREGNYPGAKTVNQWRTAYLRDWQNRMAALFTP